MNFRLLTFRSHWLWILLCNLSPLPPHALVNLALLSLCPSKALGLSIYDSWKYIFDFDFHCHCPFIGRILPGIQNTNILVQTIITRCGILGKSLKASIFLRKWKNGDLY